MSTFARPHPYATLLRVPRLPAAYLAVGLSALPLGMINLAVILCIQRWTGSLTLAGWLSAVFTLGNAAGLSVQGRLLDRYGAHQLLRWAGATSAAGLGAVVVAGTKGAPPVVVAIGLAVAGLSVPAVTTAVRGRLPDVISDHTTRTAGYALLSVLFQVAVTVGPLLVSLSLLLTPELALVAAAVLLFSAGLLATTRDGLLRPTPGTKYRERTGRVQTSWTSGFVAVLMVAALTGAANGMVTVAIPGVTSAAGLATLAGFIFSGVALGDVCGALAFGSRVWPLSPWHQLAVALAAGAVLAVVAFLIAPTPWALLPVMTVGGMLAAPAAIVSSSLLDRVLPAESIARGYGLLVSVGLVAAAAGNTAAGSLAAVLPPRDLLLVVPVLLALAAAVGMLGRRHTSVSLKPLTPGSSRGRRSTRRSRAEAGLRVGADVEVPLEESARTPGQTLPGPGWR